MNRLPAYSPPWLVRIWRRIGRRPDFLKLTPDEAFKFSAALESLDPWPECGNCCREEGDDQWDADILPRVSNCLSSGQVHGGRLLASAHSGSPVRGSRSGINEF